jgi:flagellar hook protein FlgE
MSFNTGLSGIRAANADLSVTGNNIANAGTTGFKTSRAEFGDVYTSTLLGSGSNVPGSGVTLQMIRQQFSQGNFKFTQNSLDLAINGSGFFVVDQDGDRLYTRAGHFGLDKNGYVVNATGARLQGYAANETGTISGILGSLRIDVTTQAPRQTTAVSGVYNLNANEPVLETTGTRFATDGAAIGVAQSGLLEPTTTTLSLGAIATPINFGASNVSFDLQLSDSTPSSGNGIVTLTLDASTANSIQDIANLINSAIYSSPTPINVQAVDNGGVLEFRDLTPGAASTITIDNVSGANSLAAALNGAGASVAGIPAVNNGYVAQTLVLRAPNGAELTYTSVPGASAAQTASELNALAGISATARTQATLFDAGFDNSNGNLTLNGVVLSSNSLQALEDEINSLRTSLLPGITATINTAGNLEIVSAVGTDLKFSFTGPQPAGDLEILGRTGTGNQTLNTLGDALVVGGDITVVMDEGYQVVDSVPAAGNIFAPFSSLSFTDVPINAFDPLDQNTYNHATSTPIYDSLGNPHIMTQYFVRQPYDVSNPATSPNHWVMYVQIDGQDVGDPDPTLPPPANTLPTRAAFNVHFNANGTLNPLLTDTMLISNWRPIGSNGEDLGALGPLNALQGGTVPVVEPATSSNFEITLTGSTQFGSPFAVEDSDQNGYSTGRLVGLDVGVDGTIFARFTNGEAQVLGQVALANFNNLDGLKPVGSTMWAQTFESGEAVVGTPGTASLGAINSGAIEESNVDLSEQLVNLIIAQRNFQANAKTIETANATTQTVINLR